MPSMKYKNNYFIVAADRHDHKFHIFWTFVITKDEMDQPSDPFVELFFLYVSIFCFIFGIMKLLLSLDKIPQF